MATQENSVIDNHDTKILCGQVQNEGKIMAARRSQNMHDRTVHREIAKWISETTII